MGKSLKYLLQFAWVNLATIGGLALVILLGSLLTGVPQGSYNLFRTYFSSFPLMCLLILFILSFSQCTSLLNLALSFGARRRDFFLALQGILLVYTLACWVMQLVFSSVPQLFQWKDVAFLTAMTTLGGLPVWLYPLLLLAAQLLGCLFGQLYTRSRAMGVLVLVVTMVLGAVMTALLMLRSDGFFSSSPLSADPLIWALAALAAVAIVLGEILLWRIVRRYTVR